MQRSRPHPLRTARTRSTWKFPGLLFGRASWRRRRTVEGAVSTGAAAPAASGTAAGTAGAGLGRATTGGTAPAVFNAANEVAVAAFVAGEIDADALKKASELDPELQRLQLDTRSFLRQQR